MFNTKTNDDLRMITQGCVGGFLICWILGFDVGIVGITTICLFSLLTMIVVLQELL